MYVDVTKRTATGNAAAFCSSLAMSFANLTKSARSKSACNSEYISGVMSFSFFNAEKSSEVVISGASTPNLSSI